MAGVDCRTGAVAPAHVTRSQHASIHRRLGWQSERPKQRFPVSSGARECSGAPVVTDDGVFAKAAIKEGPAVLLQKPTERLLCILSRFRRERDAAAEWVSVACRSSFVHRLSHTTNQPRGRLRKCDEDATPTTTFPRRHCFWRACACPGTHLSTSRFRK